MVQTLPHDAQLNRITLANRVLIYGLLFHSTAATLIELAADPRYLGAKIGLLMVLHTWGQLMDVHTHVHVVIPGGGLSLDSERWLSCRDGFFLPVEVIGALVRGKFLAGLKHLWRAGNLKLDGKLAPLRAERTFESWLATLYAKKWVAFAQGPPSGVHGAEAVLKYLARYVSGVAISDRRLMSHANGCVRFRYKNYAAGQRSDTTTLSGVEFVRRYMLHVLPRGFVRIRRYGLLSNRQRQTAVARCRALLAADLPAGTTSAIAAGAPTATGTSVPAVASTPSAAHEASTCSSCRRGRLMLCTIWPRPTVWDLLACQPSAFRAYPARPASRSKVTRRVASMQPMALPLEDTS